MRIHFASGLGAALVALATSGCGDSEPTAKPERRDVVESVFATGQLVMEHEYVVATQAEGFVDTVYVELGDTVEKGQLLFRITSTQTSSQLATAEAEYRDAMRRADPHSPSIVSLESQVRQAVRQRDSERDTYERTEKLFRSGATPQVEFDAAALRLESAQAELDVLEQELADLRESLELGLEQARNHLRALESQHDDTLIQAARSGRILELTKEQGELARRGEVLGRIGSGQFVAEMLVLEQDIGRVRRGQDVGLRLNTAPDVIVPATVRAIHPAFDVVEQSFTVEARFEPGSLVLFSGTQLQADIVVERREDALVIPADYLHADDSVALVDGRTLRVQPVSRVGKWVEVRGDLEDGDELVVAR